MFPELECCGCDLIITVKQLSQRTVWDEMTLLFKAKSGQYVCADHLSVSLHNFSLQSRCYEPAPYCSFHPRRCYWASHPLRLASSRSYFLLTYGHVVFRAELQSVTLVCSSQQLFWDSALTHQIATLAQQNIATPFKAKGLILI